MNQNSNNPLKKNVYELALERLDIIFKEFDNVYIFRQSTLEKYKNMYNNLGEFTSEIYGEFVVLYVTLF